MTPETKSARGKGDTDLHLESLRRGHARELLELAAEFRAAGDPRYDALLEDPDATMERALWFERGEDLGPDRVRMSSYLFFAGERLVGASRLRHRLIPTLERDGGHIGYEIRPSERGCGYGIAILAHTLTLARGLGLTRVLLTAAAGNDASIRVIEANGGLPDGDAVSPNTGERMLRFWIGLDG